MSKKQRKNRNGLALFYIIYALYTLIYNIGVRKHDNRGAETDAHANVPFNADVIVPPTLSGA